MNESIRGISQSLHEKTDARNAEWI